MGTSPSGSGTTAGHGLAYTVTVTGTTATVTLSGGTLATGAAEGVIGGIAYSDTAAIPTGGLRTVTITRLVDSGSSTAPNANTATLALASTVNVATANAAPVLGGGSPGVSYTENAAGVAAHASLTLSDADSTHLQSATALPVRHWIEVLDEALT